MKVGLVLPQGLTGEYAGWSPARAWDRTLDAAVRAEKLGFESIWAYDHVQTFGGARAEPSFESSIMLSTLAGLTNRVRIGQLVACASYRNPGLLAKMVATLDVVSGGRAELGLGAGLKEDEARSYGFGFPPMATRMTTLRDNLEIVTRLLAAGRGTWQGERHSIDGAINVPRGLQSPRIPIIVGGNGPQVTWRLAARYADELNLDGLSPAKTAEALVTIRDRCAEIGRDPASLAVSVHVLPHDAAPAGPGRVRLLAAYRDLGISRVMALLTAVTTEDSTLESFVTDAASAGAALQF